MIGAPSAFAQLGAPHSKNPQTAFQSGYKWGVHDAKDPCKPDCRNVYVWQPDKTFYFHTKEFIRGYMTGFCSVVGPDSGMDENEASFDCTKTIKDPELADLTEYNATIGITDWFDGQDQRIWGGPITKPYSLEFMTGYNTTYGTLPPEIDPQHLAQKLSGP